jgi:threonine/homoserine/homoserine lactone efflux protein
VLEPYLLFASVWFVAAATPGADTMLLLATSLSRGARAAMASALGIIAAKILLLVITYFGLSALLTAAPELYQVLKIAGALFLLWRAYKAWRAVGVSKSKSGQNSWASFATAFTIAVSNPQAILFYVAVVPQVALETNLAILSLIIAVGFAIISAFYIALAKPIGSWITRGSNQLALNKVIAIVFVILATLVLLR